MELDRRLGYEEDAFAAKRRGDVAPDDYFEGGQVKSREEGARKRKNGRGTSKQVALFTDGRS